MPSDQILTLIKGLRDPSRDVRCRSACELCDFGDEARLAVPSLIQAVEGDDEWVSSWSAEALGRVRPVAEEAIPVLIKLLGAENDRVGYACAGALARMGQVAVPALLDTLKNGNDRARERSVGALCRGNPVPAEIVTALVIAFGDECELVRNASANWLGAVGPSVLPALLNALQHENEWIRAKSAYALGEIAVKDAVPALTNALRDKSRRVRSKSARALNRIRAMEEEVERQRAATQAKKSSEAKADMNHSVQAGPRRERFKGPEIITRVRDAVRVLSGVRPAEVSFDELDRWIGESCSAVAANTITALLAPDTDDLDAYDHVHSEVTRFVFEAIKEYATHEAKYGLFCREELRSLRACDELRRKEGKSDIPS